jgi:septum formation protein
VLASASPRRAELLASWGQLFERAPTAIEEVARAGETPRATCLRLACEKANAAAEGRDAGTVLGSDTIIEIDGDLLGKPTDAADARAMLSRLAGRRHHVVTAVALVHVPTGTSVSDLTASEVEMSANGWLDDYVACGEWEGKAGAYAIQGLAASFSRVVSGSMDTVIGLPRELVVRLARRLDEETR